MTPLQKKIIDWQLAHGNERETYGEYFRDDNLDPLVWQQGVFTIGRVAVGDDISQLISDLDGQLREPFRYADNQALAQAYLDFDASKYAPIIRAKMNKIIRTPCDNTWDAREDYHASRQHWSWCDTMFMAPPLWAEMTRLTEDQSYVAFMLAEAGRMIDLLYDKQRRLFARDMRYYGEPFWGRGQGWVIAGLARTKVTWFAALWSEMADRLCELQKPDGGWSADIEAGQGPSECSATALIAYGLALGVENGWGSARHSTAALAAWRLITDTMVRQDGKVLWVQQVGEKPGDISEDQTQWFGAGAVLLASTLFEDHSE